MTGKTMMVGNVPFYPDHFSHVHGPFELRTWGPVYEIVYHTTGLSVRGASPEEALGRMGVALERVREMVTQDLKSLRAYD